MKGLLKASHFGPTLIVVTVTFSLSLTQYSAIDAARVAIAIFAGQLVVGWSNDLIDFELDKGAGRVKKPLISGELNIKTLKRALPIAVVAAILLSLTGPLGLIGSALHLMGVLSALAYNVRLKATIFSPLPYAFSFGALPWAIYLSNQAHPPTWIFLGFILIAIAFHFLNVLKDLSWDIEQGVLGLPQRMGRSWSIGVSVALVILTISEVLLLKSR
jgi:4-hydroxybenzoate polyprenyltransferase